jgi:hypothetical protein
VIEARTNHFEFIESREKVLSFCSVALKNEKWINPEKMKNWTCFDEEFD